MEKLKLLSTFVIFFVLFSNYDCNAKVEVNVDMLNKLKDSGALDNITEELEKMLGAKEPQMDVPITAAYDFLMAFVNQKDLKLPESVIKALVFMPSTSESQAKHFVVLTEVADNLSVLTKHGNLGGGPEYFTEKLIDMTKNFKSVEKLLESIRANQELIDKTIKNQKNSLDNKQTKETASDGKMLWENAEDTKKDTFKNPYNFLDGLTADNIIQGVDLFVGVVKTNPDMIIDYVCNYLQTYEMVSKKSLNLVRSYAKNFAKADYFTSGIEYFGDSISKMVNTKGGRQMLELIPTMANADSRDTVTDLLKSQTEVQWENFFNAISNSDMRNSFLVKIASTVEYLYSQFLMNDMKMMMVNAFLMTQNLPPITPRRFLPSAIDLIGKSIRVFTAMDVDFTIYEKLAKELTRQFAEEYVDANELAKLKEEERIQLFTRFLDENVVVSAQELWRAHQHVFGKAMPMIDFSTQDKTPADITRNLHCAENLLCNINAHSRKDPSMIRRTTSKGLSLAMAWTWGMSGVDLDQMKLYVALHAGADILSNVDCEAKYSVTPPGSCKIFEWQTDKMSLDFDSNELPESTQEKSPRHEEL